MTRADLLIRAGAPTPCGGAIRIELAPDAWRGMAAALGESPAPALVGLWADQTQVHALFDDGAPLIVSTLVEAGLYAALSPARPGAALFERMVSDLWGHQAADARDVRPWLDHGTWPLLRPLSDRPALNASEPDVPEMVATAAAPLPFGPLPPLPAPMAGPAHWRAAVEGSRVVQLEARLGYAHRGVLGLMRGKSPAGAARFAGRIDGAATVAHATAFARAVEATLGLEPPPRALAMRTALLAVERVAVGLHDLYAAAAAIGAARPAWLAARARLLEASAATFDHRLLRDAVRPGGVQDDVPDASLAALDEALRLVPSVAVRWSAGVGVLPVGAAAWLGLSGIAGRASGHIDPANPHAPPAAAGDSAARLRLRADKLTDDVEQARTAIATLPPGAAAVPLPHHAGEGLGWADGPRGRVWHWVRLSGGLVTANFAIDPAWLLLPAFEAAASDVRVESLSALAASFGLHWAGMEL